MDCSWMGVGVWYPAAATARCSSGIRDANAPLTVGDAGRPADGWVRTWSVDTDALGHVWRQTYDAEAMYRIRHLEDVKSDILDPIDYGYAGRRSIDITIDQPEYTSVCPMTGLPDVGCITIQYRPNQKIIELKF